MKLNLNSVCVAACITGAFALGGAAMILLIKSCRGKHKYGSKCLCSKSTVSRCPLCGIALNENGVCPECGFKN